MIEFTHATVVQLFTHYVSSPLAEGGMRVVTKVPVQCSDQVEQMALQYLLSGFGVERQFRLRRVDREGRESPWIRRVTQAFEEKESFWKYQEEIVDHLEKVSTHPKVPSGYLHVVLFDNVVIDGEVVKAFGIFKSERKEGILTFDEEQGRYVWNLNHGYPMSKLDKGCLILNVEGDEGYVCLALDKKSGSVSELADFWMKDFMHLDMIDNEYQQTIEMINLTKNFVTHEAPRNHQIGRPDEIDLLNRSQAYFKGNENFSTDDFVDRVFEDPEIAQSFTLYKENQRLQNGESIPDHFAISNEALKKQGKVFKSVLKLDKNFHVYIHGDRNRIMKGREDDGRKFYKIYYDQEG